MDIWHYNGSVWSKIVENAILSGNGTGVWTSSKGEVYASAFQGNAARGYRNASVSASPASVTLAVAGTQQLLPSPLDAGANPEAKPSHLIGYAVMGSVYAKHVLKSTNPTVGLMSNGEEDEKGTAFTKETFVLLKQIEDSGIAPFKFLGNVEGHDIFDTKLDVCLCDGFTGNVVLKSCEATAKAMANWLKREFKRGPIRMMGALLGKGAFQAVKDRTNYESVGGSPLLGVNGVCVIAHGGSSALAIRNALRVASETVECRVNPLIEEALEALKQQAR